MVAAVSIYDVVLAVHIIAVVVAFGGLFAYPLLVGAARRADPRALRALHRAQQQIIGRLILPGLVVVVAAGIYLAADHEQFSEFYVQWGFIAFLALGGLFSGFLAPREGKLAALAERDAGGGGALSDEYDTLSQQVKSVSALVSLLVLATILIMTIKP